MYITQTDIEIAWMMFRDWLKKVFGGGVNFHLAPTFQPGYIK